MAYSPVVVGVVVGMVRAARFELAVSCFQGKRGRPNSPTPCLGRGSVAGFGPLLHMRGRITQMAAPVYTIVPAKMHHCGILGRKICDGRWLSYRIANVDPKQKIRECFSQSCVAKSVIMDGKVVAMGGLTGSLMSRSGIVWLVVSREFTRYPIALVKEAKAQLSELLKMKPEIHATVVEQDSTARHFAKFLGFVEDGERCEVHGTGVFVIPVVLKG